MNYKILSQAVRARRKSMNDQLGGVAESVLSETDARNLHVLRCSRWAADDEALYTVSGRQQDKDQAEHWRALAKRGGL